MNLDEIKEAVNYYRGVGGVGSRTNVYEHCLLNLASLILESASVMPKEPKCGKSYPSCVVCPYDEDCETYDKILIIEQCTLAHTRILLEKDEEIVKLTNALSAVQMLIEEDIEEDKGFTFNRKKMIDKIKEAL